MKNYEQELIQELIIDLENLVNLATRYNQESQPKFKELSIKKRLLEEALRVSESRVIPEVQLRDLWLNENEV